jgi:hypothetical protein
MIARKPAKVAAVALANKNARIIWASMKQGGTYQKPEPFPQHRKHTGVRRYEVWQSERDLIQNRSSRGSGKPGWVKAHQARAFGWDPIQLIALGPAAINQRRINRPDT